MKLTLFYERDTKNFNVFSTPRGSGQIALSVFYPKKRGKKMKRFLEIEVPDSPFEEDDEAS